jgi:hypothetical protein
MVNFRQLECKSMIWRIENKKISNTKLLLDTIPTKSESLEVTF